MNKLTSYLVRATSQPTFRQLHKASQILLLNSTIRMYSVTPEDKNTELYKHLNS
jgi:hypothetical protein